MQIGTLLRKLRDKKRLSTREISGKMGIAHSTYMDWEHDKTSPSLKLYLKLASALEVNPVELMAYLTGETDDIMAAREKSSMAELKEMVRFYQEHNYLLKQDRSRVEAEIANIKESMALRYDAGQRLHFEG